MFQEDRGRMIKASWNASEGQNQETLTQETLTQERAIAHLRPNGLKQTLDLKASLTQIILKTLKRKFW